MISLTQKARKLSEDVIIDCDVKSNICISVLDL